LEGKNRPKIGDDMIGADEPRSRCPVIVDEMIAAGADEPGGKNVKEGLSKESEVTNGRVSDSVKRASTILIGFLHDLATGCWAATVLAVYWLDRSSVKMPELASALGELKREFFYLGLVCVAVVLAGGVGRTFTYAYVGKVYGEEAEQVRRKMLIVKHIVLFFVFGAGIYWQYTMAFK
jgi:hypothetical protein